MKPFLRTKAAIQSKNPVYFDQGELLQKVQHIIHIYTVLYTLGSIVLRFLMYEARKFGKRGQQTSQRYGDLLP